MKILFLDVDGVLNTDKTNLTDPWPMDPFMVLLVDRIVQATGCKVVLSSAWRHSEEGVDKIKAALPLYGITPTSTHGDRGEEIESWILDYTLTHASPNPNDWVLTSYAILDDCEVMQPQQQEHFFKTSFQIGLTEEIANKVIEHLNKV